MCYFTERHGLRSSIVQKSLDIDYGRYSIIFDCCEKYFDNLSYRFPVKCPDNGMTTGVNTKNLLTLFRCGEIPDLFDVKNGYIGKPDELMGAIYDQNALLDLIEFLAKNIRDVKKLDFHSYFGHHHLEPLGTRSCLDDFQKEINKTFEELRLLYRLSNDLQVERISENSPLTPELETTLLSVKEPGLRELLSEAILYHRSHKKGDWKVAVDKIWDAFERLKTYYSGDDEVKEKNDRDKKKYSVGKVIKYVSETESQDLMEMLNREFTALTEIGNNYRIRHSETTQTDVSDPRIYDYFFNRCVSLIALAIPYLK